MQYDCKKRLALTNFRITQYLRAKLLKGFTPFFCFSLAETISGIKRKKWLFLPRNQVFNLFALLHLK